MSNKITAGVITSKNRDTFTRTLNSLGAAAPGFELHVFADKGHDCQSAHLEAWKELVALGGDYLLLIQDDVIASKNWHVALDKMIEKTKAEAITLYSARKEIVDQEAKQRCYAELPIFINEQALCVSNKIAKEFIQYCESGAYKADLPEKEWKHNDMLWQRFFKNKKLKVIATSPSFVQHIGTVSVLGHGWKVNGKPRESQYFLGEGFDLSVLTI